VVFTGLAAMTLDLSDTTSLDEALKKIAAYAAAHPNGWIIGQGWIRKRGSWAAFPPPPNWTPSCRSPGVAGPGGWPQAGPTAARWRWRGDAARSGGGRIERLAAPRPTSPRPPPRRPTAAPGKPQACWWMARRRWCRKWCPSPARKTATRRWPCRGHLLSHGVTAARHGHQHRDWQAMRRAGDAGTLKGASWPMATASTPWR
jgi:hypothetical protein